jgi:hypothetical protein|uniref:ShKT domain-containing protein n=1 Tax=Odontella aurita TaxID=265563 RepID=A0A7S4JVC8_9STRA|mmetsp:Transcript_54441/g.162724  ORF Transcript_54441/g.162724 Transcript_54441/m.162724 type:complete len:264 (+) Transcript_54441:83-874(+)
MKLSTLSYNLAPLFLLGSAQECPPPGIDTVDNFDLGQFIAARWYVHEQTVTVNTPIENLYCSYAEYAMRPQPSVPSGYTVDVTNYAQDSSGNEFVTGRSPQPDLCADQEETGGTDASKLVVAPCFLPKEAAGPYWVVYYDEANGVAVVSGGSPDVNGASDTCKTMNAMGDSGLWIFLRSANREEDKIEGAKAFLRTWNYDLSILNLVDQTDCVYDDTPAEGNTCEDGTDKLSFFWSTYTCDALPWFGCWLWAEECPKTCHVCE